MRGTGTPSELCLPDYGGACIVNVVPTVLSPPSQRPGWWPLPAWEAEKVVLLLVDGLGWNQLQARRQLAPTLAAMVGGPISTVVPSTTATALTSLTTGTTPGEHGVVGYRLRTHGEVLNVLRWRIGRDDVRDRVVPEELQPVPPFLGQAPVVVSGASFVGSGFSRAHLRGGVYRPWVLASSIVVEATASVGAGAPFTYAYYEGLDKVGHQYGLAAHYDAELRAVDRLVSWLIEALPPEACLVVTADHGQVDVGEQLVPLHPDLAPLVVAMSGEARLRWLHARAGSERQLLEVARSRHPDAWVVDRETFIDGGWMGPRVGRYASERLGDVAVASIGLTSYDDPADTGPIALIGRHGSMTADEMLVPLLASRGAGPSNGR